jgi:hypothetical protein
VGAFLLTCLALSAICVISASYVCLIHCLMMFGAVGLIFLPLLNTPSIEGLLSQRVEALDGPGTGLILQAIGASDDVQGYVQAQITVLATRKAGPGRTVLPSNSAISIVQRAGTKFRDSGRRGMSVEVLHSMEREILGHASSPPALQYERQQLARAEHYARRPPVFEIAAMGGAVIAVILALLALRMRNRSDRIASLMKTIDTARAARTATQQPDLA